MFSIDVTQHYSVLTTVFYIALGAIGALSLCRAKKQELIIGRQISYKNKFLFLWWSIWCFFSVFRLVNQDVGGIDARSYIFFFENCNGFVSIDWFDHVENDFGFKWITKTCRYITSEYRFYFFVIYGFMAFVYIEFLKKYTPTRTNFIPFILCFFPYLLSYNTIRTSLAASFILFGCCFVIEKKWKYAYLIGFAALFIHKSAVIYVMGIPFCHFFSCHKLNIKIAFLSIYSASAIVEYLRDVFLKKFTNDDFKAAFHSYAANSVGVSFWDEGWKIAFEQMLLAAIMLLTYKKIGQTHCEKDRNRLQIIWILCIFDFMLIPVNFVLGSWRGYEFFYLPRLVMWGECIYQITRNTSPRTKFFCKLVAIISIVLWMWFRIDAVWFRAQLSPYIFEPLLLVF